MIKEQRESFQHRRGSDKEKNSKLFHSLELIDKYIIRSVTNLDGIIIDISQAFCDISGYTKDELLGQPHSILRHKDISKSIFKDMWKIIKSGNPWSGELQNLKKDGTSYWLNLNIEPNYDENNNIDSYIAIGQKITNTKELESLLEKNKAIIKFAHSGIGSLDLEGNFLEVNDGYTHIFGYEKDEFIGKNCKEITRDDYYEISTKSLQIAKEVGALVKMQKVCKHKDGSDVYIEFSLDLLPDKESFVMIVNSLNDKMMLEDLNNSLEERVKAETKKNIKQLDAMQQERLKNIRLNTIGSLAAGITHEINTPLTYIKGNFEMMQQDINDLPQNDLKMQLHDDSIKIVDGINRISNIVEAMREMSQTSKGKTEKTNIYNTIITALTLSYNRSKQQSKIYVNGNLFALDIKKDLCEFNCDIQKQRIEQVWIVIINNALDELVKIENYELRMLSINISKNEDNIIIRFKDNAGGIPANIINKVFDPFVSTKQSGGIGVGLNIAQKIIQEHQGFVKAYNEDDGAVFEIKLKAI